MISPVQLDQFFTKPPVARKCWRALQPVLAALTGKTADNLYFIEPSAGDGNFYDLLPGGSKGQARRLGIDITPRRAEFIGADFLNLPPLTLQHARADTVIIGNPPFGKRGTTAVQFFNKAGAIADTIAFIVPVIFRKHFIHKQLPADWRWVHATPLARDSFWTDQHRTYAVHTEFQVWTRLPSRHKDRRLLAAPPLTHADFEFWQYNNTQDALKFFKTPFAFAVPCQGWQDYTRRETDAGRCEKTKQWMLFKPHHKAAHRRLYRGIDYQALALKHTTSTPGFRKADLVQEYTRLFG